MSQEAVGALIAAAGGIVGGLLTIFGTVVVEAFRRVDETNQLAHSIASEVRAVVDMLERGRYVEHFERLASEAFDGPSSAPNSDQARLSRDNKRESVADRCDAR